MQEHEFMVCITVRGQTRNILVENFNDLFAALRFVQPMLVAIYMHSAVQTVEFIDEFVKSLNAGGPTGLAAAILRHLDARAKRPPATSKTVTPKKGGP